MLTWENNQFGEIQNTRKVLLYLLSFSTSFQIGRFWHPRFETGRNKDSNSMTRPRSYRELDGGTNVFWPRRGSRKPGHHSICVFGSAHSGCSAQTSKLTKRARKGRGQRTVTYTSHWALQLPWLPWHFYHDTLNQDTCPLRLKRPNKNAQLLKPTRGMLHHLTLSSAWIRKWAAFCLHRSPFPLAWSIRPLGDSYQDGKRYQLHVPDPTRRYPARTGSTGCT